ncbi:MAG TPA: PEP/pyruvate-binding domain-containing protein, partial [Gemmatirosa sp.]
MTPHIPPALPTPLAPTLSGDPLSEESPSPPPAPTEVEDTTSADVGDNAANEAADALIDAAEEDPVRPGEPADAHTDSEPGPSAVHANGVAGETRLVYYFGVDGADGTKDMKPVLGGKGANLAEMVNLGVPVPPGFTITCQVCGAFLATGDVPSQLRHDVARNLARLERETGRRFGDAADPLLVSVRSGAPVSMPGMMETILNL